MTQKTNTILQTEATETVMSTSTMSQDLKSAVLIVSVVVNLFIFTTWVALQVPTQFDTQIASLLFTR